MKLTSIGTVIARRDLALSGGGKVVVEIGKPRKFRGSPDYFCPFRIRGLGKKVIMSMAGGVDAIQALELAFLRIGIALYIAPEAKSGKLSWGAGQVKGDLGFPLLDIAADLLPEKVRPVYVRKSFPVPRRPRHRTPPRGAAKA